MDRMQMTFRLKLTGMVLGLILTAAGGSSFFLVDLYRKDKLSGLFEGELTNTRGVASRIESLLTLADVIVPQKVVNSREIIFIADQPCAKTGPGALIVSKFHARLFNDLDIKPEDLVSAPDLVAACLSIYGPKAASAEMAATTSHGPALIPTASATSPAAPAGVDPASAEHDGITILPDGPQLSAPYLRLLLHGPRSNRLVFLSVDGFNTAAANTLFVTDRQGKLIWSADGEKFVKTALFDTGITEEDIKMAIIQARSTSQSNLEEKGRAGLLSYARIGPEWVIFSLTYRPTAFQPIYYALFQSICLVLGFVFLCFFFGKNFSSLLTRPLLELKASAERIGRGDFGTRFLVKGMDEFSTVKEAFNTMIERIMALIEDTKAKANLESELELAQQVQALLMPKESVDTKDFHLSSFVRNASQCGGDWWGYMEGKNTRGNPALVVLIGDATSHGAASALVTAAARGALSMLTSWIESRPEMLDDPTQILKHFNRAIWDAARGSIGMTFFAAVIDPVIGEMRTANAGHNFPYLIMPQAAGAPKIKAITQAGVPLGYNENVEYESFSTHEWQKGFQLLLYTDGLIEVMKDDQSVFDRRKLLKSLQKNGTSKGKGLLSRVLNEWEKDIQGIPQPDDVTVVLCGPR